MKGRTMGDMPTGERTARCGHTYQGTLSGRCRKHCSPECDVRVTPLDLPGRPSLTGEGPGRPVGVAVTAAQSAAITARAVRYGGDRSKAIRALLTEGASVRAAGSGVPWGAGGGGSIRGTRWGVPTVAREWVWSDPTLSGVIATLRAQAVADGVPSRVARAVVLRALLDDAIGS